MFFNGLPSLCVCWAFVNYEVSLDQRLILFKVLILEETFVSAEIWKVFLQHMNVLQESIWIWRDKLKRSRIAMVNDFRVE